MPGRQAVSLDFREGMKRTEFGKSQKGIERVGKDTWTVSRKCKRLYVTQRTRARRGQHAGRRD